MHQLVMVKAMPQIATDSPLYHLTSYVLFNYIHLFLPSYLSKFQFCITNHEHSSKHHALYETGRNIDITVCCCKVDKFVRVDGCQVVVNQSLSRALAGQPRMFPNNCQLLIFSS